jgi:hypothetical protein
MSLFDPHVGAGSEVGWKADVLARLGDFLARKALPVGAKLDSFLRAIEGAVESSLTLERVKGTLAALKARLRRERHGAVELAAGGEAELLFERLCLQILEHQKTETIENYSAYLFTPGDTRLE